MAKKKVAKKKITSKKITKKKAAKKRTNKKSSNVQIKTKPSGHAFILTPVEPQVELPYEIIPKHYLQKADKGQIDNIKKKLNAFSTFPIPEIAKYYLPPYEYDLISVHGNKPNNIQYEYKKLPAKKWRYWIIRFQGTNSELQELRHALSLMEQDIELGFTFIAHPALMGDSFGWNAQHLHTYFNDRDRCLIEPKKITSPDIRLAGECYFKMKELPKKYPHIKRAFRRFDTLRSVPLASELTVIGLFSIIESLLTHAPNKNDPTDSLTRQIKHKMPLVRKRFQRSIDHNTFFNGINENNLWAKLYEFRSKIVHGENADISGKLSGLKNKITVIKFLREIVKLLLIQSLREPILLTDLKGC